MERHRLAGAGPGLWALFDHYYRRVPDGLVNDRWLPWSPLLGASHTEVGRRAIDAVVERQMKRAGGLVPPRPPHFDVRTPEYVVFDDVQRTPWECVRGMDQSFGYNAYSRPEDFIAHDDLLWLVADIVAKGGNLLLNVGPRGVDAQIPDEQAVRLEWLGGWVGPNREALAGTAVGDARHDRRRRPPGPLHGRRRLGLRLRAQYDPFNRPSRCLRDAHDNRHQHPGNASAVERLFIRHRHRHADDRNSRTGRCRHEGRRGSPCNSSAADRTARPGSVIGDAGVVVVGARRSGTGWNSTCPSSAPPGRERHVSGATQLRRGFGDGVMMLGHPPGARAASEMLRCDG